MTDEIENAIRRVISGASVGDLPLSRRLLKHLGQIDAAQRAGIPLSNIAREMEITPAAFYAALRRARKYAEKHGTVATGPAGGRSQPVSQDSLPPPPGSAKANNESIGGFKRIVK